MLTSLSRLRWDRLGEQSRAMIRSSGLVMSSSIGAAIFGLLSQFVLARSLSHEAFGIYAIAMGWCLLLVGPAMSGVDAALVRFGPQYIVKGLGAQLRRLVRFLVCYQALVFALIALVGAMLLGLHHPPGLIRGSNVALFVILFSTAILSSFPNLMTAFQRYFWIYGYQHMIRPAVLIVALLVMTTGLREQISAASALAATAVVGVVVVLLVAVHGALTLRRFGREGVAEQGPSHWFAYCGWSQVGSIGILSASHLPIVILGAWSTAAEAANYAIALRLSSFILLGLAAVSTVVSPKISAAFAEQNREKVASLARGAALIATSLSAIAGLFVPLAGPLILALFGKDFGGAYLPLLVLAVGGFVNAATGVNAVLLSMDGHQRFAVAMVSVGAFLTGLACLILVPPHGAMGAAISSIIGMLFANLVMAAKCWTTLGLNSLVVGPRMRSAA